MADNQHHGPGDGVPPMDEDGDENEVRNEEDQAGQQENGCPPAQNLIGPQRRPEDGRPHGDVGGVGGRVPAQNLVGPQGRPEAGRPHGSVGGGGRSVRPQDLVGPPGRPGHGQRRQRQERGRADAGFMFGPQEPDQKRFRRQSVAEMKDVQPQPEVEDLSKPPPSGELVSKDDQDIFSGGTADSSINSAVNATDDQEGGKIVSSCPTSQAQVKETHDEDQEAAGVSTKSNSDNHDHDDDDEQVDTDDEKGEQRSRQTSD